MYILKSIAKAADFPLQAKLHSTLHASQLHDTHGFNSRKHNKRCIGTFETHVAFYFRDILRQEQIIIDTKRYFGTLWIEVYINY